MRIPHKHLSADEARALLEPEVFDRPGRQIAAAAQLAQGCPACWDALEKVRRPVDRTPTPSPIREAMLRLVSPGSWPALGSGHFEAVLTARQRPFGFLVLVVDETAWLLSRSEHIALFETVSLATMLGLLHGYPALADVSARLDVLRVEVDLAGRRRRKAVKALNQALADADRYGVGPTARVRLLQGQARLARRLGWTDPPAESFYLEAIRLAGDERPMQQLELTAELVSLDGWCSTDAVRRLTGALHATKPARTSSDPFIRAHALYRSARLLTRAVGNGLGGLRVPDAVAELADELEAAEDLFADVADPLTRARADQCLGELRFFHAPARAREPLHRALETFLKAGASRLVEEARETLADLDRLLAMPGLKPRWTAQPILE